MKGHATQEMVDEGKVEEEEENKGMVSQTNQPEWDPRCAKEG